MGKGVKEMAKSPAHRFGQIIGDLLEKTLIRYCKPTAIKHGMYLDYKHCRPARNNQNEVRWQDINGNTHKLDIVIEAGGTEEVMGKPRAFIEIAWRRYTKHAKNKTQEISAAIKPLVLRYNDSSPFYGVVLAGEFTKNSLEQIQSEVFKLLFFSTIEIEKAFASEGINAHWEENTPDEELLNRVKQAEALSAQQLEKIGDYLMSNKTEQWVSFVNSLKNALCRTLLSIHITSLYGDSKEFTSIKDACDYINLETSPITFTQEAFQKYEIVIKFSNGDRIEMQFKEKQTALLSLAGFSS